MFIVLVVDCWSSLKIGGRLSVGVSASSFVAQSFANLSRDVASACLSQRPGSACNLFEKSLHRVCLPRHCSGLKSLIGMVGHEILYYYA